MDLRKFIFRDNFMATYAKILNDASGNQILPYSRAKLIYMDDNSTVQAAVTTNASTSVFGRVKVGSNITVSSGTISLTSGNVTSALSFTPANNTMTKYRYKVTLAASSWATTPSGDTNATNYPYYYSATANAVADNGGALSLLGSKMLSAPMAKRLKDGNSMATLMSELNKIGAGYYYFSANGSNYKFNCYVKNKPTIDLTIYFNLEP